MRKKRETAVWDCPVVDTYVYIYIQQNCRQGWVQVYDFGMCQSSHRVLDGSARGIEDQKGGGTGDPEEQNEYLGGCERERGTQRELDEKVVDCRGLTSETV